MSRIELETFFWRMGNLFIDDQNNDGVVNPHEVRTIAYRNGSGDKGLVDRADTYNDASGVRFVLQKFGITNANLAGVKIKPLQEYFRKANHVESPADIGDALQEAQRAGVTVNVATLYRQAIENNLLLASIEHMKSERMGPDVAPEQRQAVQMKRESYLKRAVELAPAVAMPPAEIQKRCGAVRNLRHPVPREAL